MQRKTRLIILALVVLIVAGCAHYPLNMSEAEWNRLNPEQQLVARKEQAIAREKARQEREARKAEQARLQEQRDIADGMIARFGGVCMGGSRCPDRDKKMHVFGLHEFVFVDKVVMTAHDNVGSRHGATLALYADNKLIADRIDIKRNGSTQTLFVGVVARNLVLRIRDDDEVKIQEFKVFGQPLGRGKARIVIRHP